MSTTRRAIAGLETTRSTTYAIMLYVIRGMTFEKFQLEKLFAANPGDGGCFVTCKTDRYWVTID